jgi:nucleoside-diphosphate-sugar epimerase
MTILITGSSGFVGSALCRTLRERGFAVRPAGRSSRNARLPDLGGIADYTALCEGVGTVVHCAARVHGSSSAGESDDALFRKVNVDGTLSLARQAVDAGVRRFVFLSSIKVNGEASRPGKPFRASDAPAPSDAYARSKAEAEVALLDLGERSGLDVVIVRPPLVYGPGVRAHFLKMMEWVARGVPLPLGGIQSNRRSLVAVDNLIDLLTVCIEHPAAAGRVFLVSDGEDLSTSALLRRLAAAMDTPARLFPVPGWMLRVGGRLVGLGDEVCRLSESLQADISETRALLGWRPPIDVDEGLRRVAGSDWRGRTA